ncbi:MAG TPA: DinB family protein [Gemmatimonadaceae bacterium]|nr:DinB family protein [Gemmatimonadaceae bacterium]
MFIRPAIMLAFLVAPPLFAQGPGSSPRSPDSEVRDQWVTVSKYLARSAAAVPESSYAYKPVATVRSFGQLVAHVAGSQMMFCAAALGEKVPAEDDFEKRNMSKAELVKALDESNTYCARAYAVSPSNLGGAVEMFGEHFTQGGVLVLNATHDNEHYGNMVTYMRMLGLVPPSSQPAQ